MDLQVHCLGVTIGSCVYCLVWVEQAESAGRKHFDISLDTYQEKESCGQLRLTSAIGFTRVPIVSFRLREL